MRLLPLLVLLCPLVSLAACDKPTESDCKKAAANMQKVEGVQTQGSEELLDTHRFIRQCRSQFSKKAVTCVINAKTTEDLDACFPAKKGAPAKPAPAPTPTPTAPAPTNP